MSIASKTFGSVAEFEAWAAEQSEDVRRFWSRVEKIDANWKAGGCWNRPTKSGRTDYTSSKDVHVAWASLNGPEPAGCIVYRSCGSRRCLRPEHLYAGTYEEMLGNASAHGRLSQAALRLRAERPEFIRRGEAARSAKLTEANVAEIRRRWFDELVPAKVLAREFGVHANEISGVCSGRLWTHSYTGEHLDRYQAVLRLHRQAALRRREGTGNYKLTRADAEAIRQAVASGTPGIELARKYGVANGTISRIARGLCWTDAADPIVTASVASPPVEALRLCGFPRVRMSTKHAAVLMLTDATPEAVAELSAPWEAFLIDVPAGLVGIGEAAERFEVTHVLVTTSAGRVAMRFGDRERWRREVSVGSLSELATWKGDGASEEMLARFVVGVCIEMTAHRPAPHLERGEGAVQRDAAGRVEPRTYTLARDVKLDARRAVHAISLGRARTSPTLASVVRGHWKMQAHGVGGSERKRIFIEPYRRNVGEGRAFALRSHVLGTESLSSRSGEVLS